MTKMKKIGIIIIVVGVFIPSVLYPFASLKSGAFAMKIILASKGVVYQQHLDDLEVVFKNGTWIKEGNYGGHYEGRIAIPYKYTLAIGIMIVFLGICLIVLGGKKKSNNSRTP